MATVPPPDPMLSFVAESPYGRLPGKPEPLIRAFRRGAMHSAILVSAVVLGGWLGEQAFLALMGAAHRREERTRSAS
jgi:hypothetical protein